MQLPIVVDGKELTIEVDQNIVDTGIRICRLVDSGEINIATNHTGKLKYVVNLRNILEIGLREAAAICNYYPRLLSEEQQRVATWEATMAQWASEGEIDF